MLENGVRSFFEVTFMYGKMCVLLHILCLFIPGRIELVQHSILNPTYNKTQDKKVQCHAISQKLEGPES